MIGGDGDMRNEYTDYIAHGHKYFAVVDLGKKNSAGKKLRRYFYSANEYKAYLQGKKTLDDKLLTVTSQLTNKAKNKIDGVKAIGKGMASAIKGVNNTNREVKALKKQGLSEEEARIKIRDKSAAQHAKRAGLTVDGEYTNNAGQRYLSASDAKGKKYKVNMVSRSINEDRTPQHPKGTDSEDRSSELIKKQREKEAEKSKYSKIFERAVKKPNQVPTILKPAQKVGNAITKAVREDITERLIEKGINKANAEAMRKKLEETYERATKIGESANNLKGRLDKLQEAFTSGDGDKALDAIDETLKDQEAIQKDILTIVDEMLPEAKNVADTFIDMGKKTLDTATAGPKAVAGDTVDEYLKEHNISKDDVSKEFLEELKENLKKNRK